MPFKDSQKQKEYQRGWQRRKRAGGSTKKLTLNLEPKVRIKSAQDVLRLLEKTINEVQESKADIMLRGRLIGYLAGIMLRGLELSSLEERLAALEEIILQKGNKPCPQILKTG